MFSQRRGIFKKLEALHPEFPATAFGMTKCQNLRQAACGMGWHRVTFYGNLRDPVVELCDRLRLELIEEA